MEVLVKENKDFDYFCDVFESEGYRSCSSRLKVVAVLDKRQTLLVLANYSN